MRNDGSLLRAAAHEAAERRRQRRHAERTDASTQRRQVSHGEAVRLQHPRRSRDATVGAARVRARGRHDAADAVGVAGTGTGTHAATTCSGCDAATTALLASLCRRQRCQNKRRVDALRNDALRRAGAKEDVPIHAVHDSGRGSGLACISQA
jgi:hypothetical protein